MRPPLPSTLATRVKSMVGGSKGSDGFGQDDPATESDGNGAAFGHDQVGSKRTGTMKVWQIVIFKYGRNKPRAPKTGPALRSGGMRQRPTCWARAGDEPAPGFFSLVA